MDFLNPQKNVYGRDAFLGGRSSGWISVSAVRLIVTENTELFLKNSSAGVNN